VPELLQTSGSRLLPAYRMMPRCSHCYAFLVANIGWELDTIRQWATKVLSAQGVGCKLGQEWVTPDDPWWRARGEKTAAVYEPFHAAINGTIWEGDALDRIGAAMQRWQGVGRCDGLTKSDLRPQVRRDRLVLGPKNAMGGSLPGSEIADATKKFSRHERRAFLVTA